MTQTKAGAIKSTETLLKKDPNYFKKLGHAGGSVSNPNKGFASLTPEQRAEISRKGGLTRLENYKKRKGQHGNKNTEPTK